MASLSQLARPSLNCTLPTTSHALALAGLKPKTKDIAEILAVRVEASGKAILVRKFVKEMSTGIAADGRYLTAPRGKLTQITRSEGAGKVYLSNPSFQGKEIEDYGFIDQPAFRQWVWQGKTDDGAVILGNNDIMLHPDAYKLLSKALGKSWFKEKLTVNQNDSAGKALVKTAARVLKEDVGQGSKATLFSGLAPSTFHIVHQGYHALVYEAVNPFTFFNQTEIRPDLNPAQADAVQHGLMLVDDRNNRDFARGARDTTKAFDARILKFLEQWLRNRGMKLADVGADTLQMFRMLPELFHETMFKSYIPKLKWATYEKTLRAYEKKYAADLAGGKVSLDDVKFMVASQANAAYGGLNTFFVDKTLLDVLSTTQLAPDYFWARRAYNLKTLEGGAALVGGDRKANVRNFYMFTLMSGLVYLATRALNKSLAEPDDDDPWKIKDMRHAFALVLGNRSYDIRSEAQDALTMLFGEKEGVLASLGRFSGSRISPLSRLALEFMTRRNYRGEEISTGEIFKGLAQQSVPMPLQGYVRISDTQKKATRTPFEQFLGAMGLQIKRVSPRNDMYSLAADWREKHAAEFGLKPKMDKRPTSDYTPMRYALEDDDLVLAKEKFEKMLAGGKSLQKIRNGFKQSLDAGSPSYIENSKANRAFLNSLTAEEKRLYEADRRQRKEVWERFNEMLND